MSDAGLRNPAARKGSFIGTVKAVLWSFLGIRRRGDSEKDVEQLNPVHLIVAGILGAGLFIAVLIAFVNWIVGQSPSA